MDAASRSDLVILGASLAGVAAATIVGRISTPEDLADAAAASPLVVPAFMAASTLTRRVGKFAGWYPERSTVLGLTAFGSGLAFGLVTRLARRARSEH